jgi:hypothetical protein
MTFASHFAVVTTLSGVWGIPMVAHLFKISPSAAGAPLLVFMIGMLWARSSSATWPTAPRPRWIRR